MSAFGNACFSQKSEMHVEVEVKSPRHHHANVNLSRPRRVVHSHHIGGFASFLLSKFLGVSSKFNKSKKQITEICFFIFNSQDVYSTVDMYFVQLSSIKVVCMCLEKRQIELELANLESSIHQRYRSRVGGADYFSSIGESNSTPNANGSYPRYSLTPQGIFFIFLVCSVHMFIFVWCNIPFHQYCEVVSSAPTILIPLRRGVELHTKCKLKLSKVHLYVISSFPRVLVCSVVFLTINCYLAMSAVLTSSVPFWT